MRIVGTMAAIVLLLMGAVIASALMEPASERAKREAVNRCMETTRVMGVEAFTKSPAERMRCMDAARNIGVDGDEFTIHIKGDPCSDMIRPDPAQPWRFKLSDDERAKCKAEQEGV